MTDREHRLPTDPDYWERLATRVRADAAEPLATYAARHEAWFAPLERRAGWVAAAGLVGILALWFLMPPREPSPDYRWMQRSLSPDDTAGALVASSRPPRVEVLMAQFSQLPDGSGAEVER